MALRNQDSRKRTSFIRGLSSRNIGVPCLPIVAQKNLGTGGENPAASEERMVQSHRIAIFPGQHTSIDRRGYSGAAHVKLGQAHGSVFGNGEPDLCGCIEGVG